jgi:hypothetical protein
MTGVHHICFNQKLFYISHTRITNSENEIKIELTDATDTTVKTSATGSTSCNCASGRIKTIASLTGAFGPATLDETGRGRRILAIRFHYNFFIIFYTGKVLYNKDIKL